MAQSKKETPPAEPIAQFICDAYSRQHALHSKWTVGALLEGLTSVNRFNHRSNDPHGQLLLRELAEEEVDSQKKGDSQPVNEGDATDGYFTLTLKMVELPSSLF